MDAERKMTCVMADNAVGGVSSALFTSNGIHHPEERAILNWALKPGEKIKVGAIYCVALVWIADGPASPSPEHA
jgi:hypothetical protein